MKKLSYIFMYCAMVLLIGCVGTKYYPDDQPRQKRVEYSYSANYKIELYSVERPENAKNRYGEQKIDSIENDKKYKSSFEDDLVKISWYAGTKEILFLIENKTEHSIKIPWDEAAFVDTKGISHRVMHSGVKYIDRSQPQAPSVIVRKGKIEDNIFPTDYVTQNSSGWVETPLLLTSDYHSDYTSGEFKTFSDFQNAVNENKGKDYQVLLPLEIEGVINDYIFSFKISDIATEEKTYK